MRALVLLLATSVALGSACARLEVQTCASGVTCPTDLACCGQSCVAPSCLNDRLDAGEECQTYADRACTDDRFDFGHVSCTASCTFDRAPCVRFGFETTARSPCGPASAVRMTIAADSLWTSSPLSTRVGTQRGALCATTDLPAFPAHLVAVPPDAAVAVLTAAPDERQPLRVITERGITDVAYDGVGGADGPAAHVVSAGLVDGAAVYLGRADSLLTQVAPSGGAWRAHTRRVSCTPAEPREVQSVVSRGARLLVTLVGATGATIGEISRDDDGEENAQRCTPLPYRLVVNSTVRAGGRDFLVGNVAPAVGAPFAAVFEIGDSSGAQLSLVERLGATGATGLPPLVAAVTAWPGPEGSLYVLGSRANGALALRALRDTRWREIERGSEGRRITAGGTAGGRMIVLTDHGLAESRGNGYELAADYSQAVACSDCAVRSVVRAAGNEWTLLASAAGQVAENGVPRDRPLGAAASWEPHRLAVDPEAETVWFAAWPRASRAELYLLRGIDDRYPGETAPPAPSPLLIATCGTAEIIDLAVGATHTFAALRVGAGTAACPTTYKLLARSRGSRNTVDVWQGSSPIVAIATPRNGDPRALALLEGAGPGGAATVLSFAPETDAAPSVVVSSLPSGKLRALWVETAVAGWLAGEEGLLLRFGAGQLSTTLPSQPLTWIAIDGTAPDDLFLAAAGGDLRHFDGRSWTPITPPPDETTLSSLHVTDDDIYLGLGQRVLALRVPRASAKAATCDLAP